MSKNGRAPALPVPGRAMVGASSKRPAPEDVDRGGAFWLSIPAIYNLKLYFLPRLAIQRAAHAIFGGVGDPGHVPTTVSLACRHRQDTASVAGRICGRPAQAECGVRQALRGGGSTSGGTLRWTAGRTERYRYNVAARFPARDQGQ